MKDLFPAYEKAFPKHKRLMGQLYQAVAHHRSFPREVAEFDDANYQRLIDLSAHHPQAYRRLIRTRWPDMTYGELAPDDNLSAVDYQRLAVAIHQNKNNLACDVAVLAFRRSGFGTYWQTAYDLPANSAVMLADVYRGLDGCSALRRTKELIHAFFLDPADAVAAQLRHSEIIVDPAGPKIRVL